MICPFCHADNEARTRSCASCLRDLSGLLPEGSRIASRYVITGVVGRGGMGWVYRASDVQLDRSVALKLMSDEFGRSPEMARRFRREMRLVRKLRHCNVCRVFDSGCDDGRLYVVMEHVDGTNLKQWLRRRGTLSSDEAFDTAIQIAEGLEALHDVGLAHRDVKSPNIMRDQSGVVRLMDFDIAEQNEPGEPPAAAGSHGPDSAPVLGTPEYMSPEQLRGEKADTRADIYSFGIVLYELFTGGVPFRGDTEAVTARKHLEERVPLDVPAAQRIPRALFPVLTKALAKDPAKRYPKARALLEALRLAQRASSNEVDESDADARIGSPKKR